MRESQLEQSNTLSRRAHSESTSICIYLEQSNTLGKVSIMKDTISEQCTHLSRRAQSESTSEVSWKIKGGSK